VAKQKTTTIADGQEYSGPAGISRESVWLTNEDIPHDRDTVVIIDRVLFFKEVTYPNQQVGHNILALVFRGSSRMLRVNATMKRTLNRLAGNNSCGAWKGLRIALFVEQEVRYANGTTGPAVRIRPDLPPQPGDAAPPAAHYDDDDEDREPLERDE